MMNPKPKSVAQQAVAGRRWDVVRALALLARLAFRAEPRSALVVAAIIPLDFAAPALQALGMKALADNAAFGNARGVALSVAALVGVMLFSRALAGAAWGARTRLSEQVATAMQRRLGELTTAIPTIEHFERPDYLKELDLLRQDGGGALTDLLGNAVTQLSTVGRLVVTVGLLAAVHPALALLPLFGAASLFASARAHRVRQATNEAIAEPWRLFSRLNDMAFSEAPAKELRVFGLGDELLRRHVRVLAGTDRILDWGGLRATAIQSAGWLVFAVGFAGAIWLVAVEAMAGRATIGSLVLAMALASQVNGQVAALSSAVTWAMSYLKVGARYVWLTEYAARVSRRTLPPAPVPDRLDKGIALEDVSFAYPGAPGTEKVALDLVSLHLPAGSTVAIVGENGAGKTTLVKLLCRLYEPTSGRILVDGVDARRLEPEEWRSRTSAGFQDFASFQLLARESVGVGEVSRVDDAVAVGQALERAHASDVLAALPAGLEQQLGRQFKDGAALSGGQWQKVALGRAMMREAPLLLVLDEPTAALDAQSEHALFERYAGAARRAATTNGGITLFVSHRFSTVRMADLIVVMEAGKVIACGSHADLMAQSGLYAELYELQARAYRN